MAIGLTKLPGLRAPVSFFGAAILAVSGVPAAAQQAPVISTPPPISAQPVPGELELTKLIWSTMVAVDHANRSGNYSVLRDNAATGFQIANDPARLTQIFAGLRASRIDLSTTLLLAPGYLEAPQLISADAFRVRGYFALRPTAINFDLTFQWERGTWRLFGISVVPRPMTVEPAVPAKPQQPPPQPRRN
jgi:hypothetical protein